METGIQSSFIPQDAGKVPIKPRYERSGGLSDLLLLISIVLLVTSGALAGAVFLYKQYLETTAAGKKQQLEDLQKKLDPNFMQKATRLDDRMNTASAILAAHIAPSAVFHTLQQITLENVAFSSIDLKADDPRRITAKLSGVARSMNSIALEADVISRSEVIKSPIFSGISRQQDGVHFDLEAFIEPAAINYVTLVTNALRSAGIVPPQGSTGATATTSQISTPAPLTPAPAQQNAPVQTQPTSVPPQPQQSSAPGGDVQVLPTPYMEPSPTNL